MKRLKLLPLPKPVKTSVSVPGSKSYTNRALLLAALTGGKVTIGNPLVSEDTHAMIACLREFGVRSSFKGDALEVEGDIGTIPEREYQLNANLSGTTIRFLLALAATIPGTKVIRGRGRLNERPLANLVEALQELGARIEYVDKKGYPPVRVLSSTLESKKVRMQGAISSQFLSALLMVGPRIGELEIEVEGKQVSRPYIDMTIEAMKAFGVSVSQKDYAHYRVPAGQKYKAKNFIVEGDVSSASYFAAISALTGSEITLANINPKTTQADIRFLDILERMGATVTRKKDCVVVKGDTLKPVEVDMEDCPDQAQTLAVLAAFAKGKTTITGISTLRLKETERVAAIEKELAKMGIKTSSTPDSIEIHGGKPKAARIDTYGDHRMAMAFAVAGTKLAGLSINDPDVVLKTFPRFWDVLESIGVGVETKYEHPNIVLIGMRGGGKSSVAKLLSKKLGMKLADLDGMVEHQEGMDIPGIVEKYGWSYFRDRESEIVAKVSRMKDTIVSTGGGVINRPENIAALKNRGLLIFLSSPAEALAQRIESEEGKRPRLTEAATTLQEVEAILAERKKLYEAVADEVIDDTSMTLEGKVDEVLRILEERGIVKK